MRRSMRFRRRTAGFTVVELAISLLVMVVVMLGMLALFDFSNRLSHVQTNVADMQQSQRIAQQDVMRTIRMLGRGPIPLGPATNGVSLAVWNQVPEDTVIGGDDTPAVLPGTDIVTVRGVFASPVYQVNALAPGTFAIQSEDGGYVGHVDVSNMSPTSIPQDLQALKDAINSANEDPDKPRERLVLINARDLDRWSIVALDLIGSVDNGNSVRLKFTTDLGDSDPLYFDMATGDDPKDLGAVAFVGVLEEHRFYIRQAPNKTAINGTQDLATHFTRARVFPGTDEPWRGLGDEWAGDINDHPSWRIDVADNIVDLQVALGFDSPRGGGAMGDDGDVEGDDDRIYESATGDDDDWLYNSSQAVNPLEWANQRLFFVRLTTLARTDRRDAWYQSPPLSRLEDHDLTTSQFNSETDRKFRYRPLQTFIDMRNLN